MIVRPKHYSMLQILDWQFIIELKPQQKWLCEIVHENDIKYKRKYRLSRDNVTLYFSEEEFEESFKVVER